MNISELDKPQLVSIIQAMARELSHAGHIMADRGIYPAHLNADAMREEPEQIIEKHIGFLRERTKGWF